MALTLEDVDKIIDNAKPKLLKRLNFNTFLQAKLRQVDVITESLHDELQAPNLTPYQRINVFLEGLKTGPVERFLTFCRTLHTEGQGHLLLIMGVDISEIEAQADTSQDEGVYERFIHDSLYQSLIHSVQDLALADQLTDESEHEATITDEAAVQGEGNSVEVKGQQQDQTGCEASTDPQHPANDITTSALTTAKGTNDAQHKSSVDATKPEMKQSKFPRYPVVVQQTEASLRCNLNSSTTYQLIVFSDCICLTEGDRRILSWSLKHIRRYGCSAKRFFLDAGQGEFYFLTREGDQLRQNVLDRIEERKTATAIFYRSFDDS